MKAHAWLIQENTYSGLAAAVRPTSTEIAFAPAAVSGKDRRASGTTRLHKRLSPVEVSKGRQVGRGQELRPTDVFSTASATRKHAQLACSPPWNWATLLERVTSPAPAKVMSEPS